MDALIMDDVKLPSKNSQAMVPPLNAFEAILGNVLQGRHERVVYGGDCSSCFCPCSTTLGIIKSCN